MRFDAVLFDFDGTLADSFTAIATSVNHIRGLRGHSPLTVEEVKRHVGRGPEFLLRHTVPGTDIAVDLARYRSHHPTIMFEQTWLLPGAAETITGLHRAGRKVGLCSNKPRSFSLELLGRFKLAECFDLILGPEDVPSPKPAPDMVLAAMKRLELRPGQVLYVGDMTVDIETARAAGVTVWVVPTGSDALATLVAAKPDRLLRDLGEIVEVLHLDGHPGNP
jgi:phosphoglycolate phosphatase